MAAHKTWRAWGALELVELAHMRRGGMTTREIAVVLGRTEVSVRDQVNQQRLYQTRSVLHDRWEKELTRPHNLRELAARYGVHVNAVKCAKTRLRCRGVPVYYLRRRARGKETK